MYGQLFNLMEQWSKFNVFFKKKKKVFSIGRNKTGSTSIAQALKTLGYTLGDQPQAELLMTDWQVRDFKKIITFCKTADAFQDVPFSNDFTVIDTATDNVIKKIKNYLDDS